MSKVCQISGKKVLVGNNVSKAMNKTKRRFEPNLIKKRFFIPEEGKWVSLKVSTSVLKTINKKGISAVLKDSKISKAQSSLRILSGLYGILKPLDLMQAYRLEMGTKIKIKESKNLYEFWKKKVTDFLNEELSENEIFVNLASNEYSSVIDKKSLKVKMTSPIFKDFKNGKLKIISFYAKKARGLMTRYILDNDINTVNDLKGFDYGGYCYNEQESLNSNELVFVR